MNGPNRHLLLVLRTCCKCFYPFKVTELSVFLNGISSLGAKKKLSHAQIAILYWKSKPQNSKGPPAIMLLTWDIQKILSAEKIK